MSEIFSFNQRYRETKLRKRGLAHRIPELVQDYSHLPQRKEEFLVFCREEGLSSITNAEQFEQKKQKMSEKLSTLSTMEATDFLGGLRRKALVGRRLTQETNVYLRAKAKGGKAPEELTEQEFQRLGDQIEIASPWDDDENKLGTLREHDEFLSPLVVQRTGQKGNYPQKEAAFAMHRESLMVESLASSLSDEFHSGIAESLGLNVHRYKYLLKQTGSIDSLIKRFTVVPETLDDWKQKGLMEFKVRFNQWNTNFFSFDHDPWLASKAVTMLLPEGTKNEDYQKFLAARAMRYTRVTEREPDERWHSIRKNMYHKLIDGFTEVKEFAHPEMEEQARKLAVYVLAATKQPVNKANENEHEFWKMNKRPLVESVLTLKRLAYEEGLDQQPLIEEMYKRIAAEGINNRKLADKLQAINKKIGEVKRHYDKLNLWNLGDGYASDWFVKETFCKASTLDKDGKYTPLGMSRDTITVVKSPEAAQEIIDALRNMPTSR